MKRYLTGIDWIINALDYSSRRKTGVGNTSQIVLELKAPVSNERIKSRLNSIACKLPVVFGFPSRSLSLCPYWKVTSKPKDIRFNSRRLDYGLSQDTIFEIFTNEINAPFSDKREHLVFNHISSKEGNFVGMIFDHRLMEARGAQYFLDFVGNEKTVSLDDPLYGPSYLNEWLSKLKAGKKVNRFFIKLANPPPFFLGLNKQDVKTRLKCVFFDENKSQDIIRKATDEAGYLMLMPYLLSKAIVIFDKVFNNRNLLGRDYLVPVSIDTRPDYLLKKELFFNHLSFFIVKVTAEQAVDFNTVLNVVKQQIYNQVKLQMPQAIQEASLLMRIAPLRFVNFLLKLMGGGSFASFSFAFLNNMSFGPNNFMQIPVNNIIHLPRVPYPPGLGLFFNQYQNRLNAVFSYLDGIVSEREAKGVVSGVNSFL